MTFEKGTSFRHRERRRRVFSGTKLRERCGDNEGATTRDHMASHGNDGRRCTHTSAILGQLLLSAISAIARGDHNYRFKTTTTFHADTLGCCLFLRFLANVSSCLLYEWMDATWKFLGNLRFATLGFASLLKIGG